MCVKNNAFVQLKFRGLPSWLEWGQVREYTGISLEYGRSLRKLIIWTWVVAHTWIYISVFSLCLDLPGHQLLSTQHTESDLLYLLSGHLNLPKTLNLLFRVFSLSFITLSILYHTEYHSATCHHWWHLSSGYITSVLRKTLWPLKINWMWWPCIQFLLSSFYD